MTEFDFDAWSALAKQDKAAFDKARRELLQKSMAESQDPVLFMKVQCALDLMRINSLDQAQTLRQMNRMSENLGDSLKLLTEQLEKQLAELVCELKHNNLKRRWN